MPNLPKVLNTLAVFLVIAATSLSAQISPSQLFTENRTNPLGIDNPQPKFTWVMDSNARNKSQSAYQIQVSENENKFDSAIIWDSKKTESNQSTRVAYDGPKLNSLQKYFWRVKVWDERGKASKWSNVALWQMGMLNTSDWEAKWITIGYEETPQRESPILRDEFTLDKKIASATAVITAHGIYEAYLNGERIGDAYLTPGWTSYNKRLQYRDAASNGKPHQTAG